MGYYSEVAIGMAFPSRDALVAFLSYVKLGGKMPSEGLEHYKITEVSDDMVMLHAYFIGVKWYDSFPDVKCHTDMLHMAEESGAGTAFIRIGEEYSDVETSIDGGPDQQFDMWEFFGVHREIEAPKDGTPISEFINTNKE